MKVYTDQTKTKAGAVLMISQKDAQDLAEAAGTILAKKIFRANSNAHKLIKQLYDMEVF